MKRIIKNIEIILKNWIIILGTVFSLLSVFLSFFSWQDCKITSVSTKILILLLLLIISFIVSLIWIICFKNKKLIFETSAGKVSVCYGDIIKKGFPKFPKENRIVVIPYNTSFEVIVDDKVEKFKNPLISPKTIHSQWINRMKKNNVSLEAIEERIRQSFEIRNIKPIKTFTREEKARGNLNYYEEGTIAAIDGKNGVIFYLMAISEFDDKNKAQSTKQSIIRCLEKFLDFYDETGQGFDVYIPLIGTGLSRSGMSHVESLNVIKSVFQLHEEKILGEFNIVIYDKDKDIVSIFD